MQEKVEDLYQECKDRLALIEASLPTEVDGFALSPTSKLPMKVLTSRESSFWRIAELSRSSIALIETESLISCAILVRAVMESVAMIWFLDFKIESFLKSADRVGLSETLDRLLMGSKTEGELPNPISVLTLIQRVAKTLPEFEAHYNRLSEIAHPNYAGVLRHYSKFNQGQATVEFGANIRTCDAIKVSCVVGLSTALMILEDKYNSIADKMPEFIKACEIDPLA